MLFRSEGVATWKEVQSPLKSNNSWCWVHQRNSSTDTPPTHPGLLLTYEVQNVWFSWQDPRMLFQKLPLWLMLMKAFSPCVHLVSNFCMSCELLVWLTADFKLGSRESTCFNLTISWGEYAQLFIWMDLKMGTGVMFVYGFYLVLLVQSMYVGHVTISKAWQQEMIQAKENDSCCACCASDDAGD